MSCPPLPIVLINLTCAVFCQSGSPASLPSARSVASGLAPPFAGPVAFEHIKRYSAGIITLTEDEIRNAVKFTYDRGLVVEAAGAASLAAVMSGKVRTKISFTYSALRL